MAVETMAFNFDKIKILLEIVSDNETLFKTAFTHRSYLNEHPEYTNPSNERLEFLGDAVLQLLSSEYLYEKYPNSPEGELTNFRASIVCTQSLAQEAKRLGYGAHLLLSNGEDATGGRDREYILANTFEAVLGAIFLEKGIDTAKAFVSKNLLYKITEIVDKEKYKDAKSMFQEKAQELKGLTPQYKVVDSWGLDHEKTFKIGVYIGDELYGMGEGTSKQKAEQQAAITALEKLK